MICNCKRLYALFSVPVVHIHYYLSLSVMSDDHNYFEFHDEESECPTEISEETLLISATASECATASLTMVTSRQTRTLARKANCSCLILGFFSVWTFDNGTPASALRLVNSERH